MVSHTVIINYNIIASANTTVQVLLFKLYNSSVISANMYIQKTTNSVNSPSFMLTWVSRQQKCKQKND